MIVAVGGEKKLPLQLLRNKQGVSVVLVVWKHGGSIV